MEGMIGEIRLFAGNFSPKNWTYCAGQLMAIAQNTALFSILGTTYGGDGRTTFGVPDLRGRVAVGAGAGPGLTQRVLGEMAGSPTATMTSATMPMHTHAIVGGGTVHVSGGIIATMNVNTDPAESNQTTPENNYVGYDNSGNLLYANGSFNGNLNSNAISVQSNLSAALPTNMQLGLAGSGASFNIQQPYLGMSYILCVYGIFPSRN